MLKQTEEATEKLHMIPGLENLLSLISSRRVVDAAANVDLGVPITVGQLPQLHPFLHQVQIFCFYCDLHCRLLLQTAMGKKLAICGALHHQLAETSQK